MTQTRFWAFQDAASSRLANRRLALVVDPAVYQGYFPVPSAVAGRIDLTLGTDPISSLITSEGVRIEESGNLAAIVQFTGASLSGETRYDLVVCEYQYTADRNIPAVYKVVQGTFSPPGTEPVLPQPQNSYQTSICYVRIRPVAGPSSTPQVLQTDLLPAVRGQDVVTPDEMGGLKPVIDPSNANRQRIYVFAGSYPTVDRSTLIDFRGGYSELITDEPVVAAMAVNSTQYWTVGIADDQSITLIEQVSSLTDAPTLVESTVLLAVIEIVNPGTPTINRLRDIRQFITRLGSGAGETDQWADMFQETVFEQMVFDPFTTLDKVQANTFLDSGTGATPVSSFLYRLNQARTALEIVYDGGAAPTGDIEIVVGDFLAGTDLPALREFQVLALHDVPGAGPSGLNYAYSFTGSLGPVFSLQASLANNQISPIVATPAVAPGQLFLKLIFPGSLFTPGNPLTAAIFGLGIVANIRPEVATAAQLLEDARTTLENSICNLIGNTFEYWSYPVFYSAAVEDFIALDAPAVPNVSMTISGAAADIAAGVRQVGPDGWQAIWTTAGNITAATLSRVSRIGASDKRPTLRTTLPVAVGTPADLPLEYRVPARLLRVGDVASMAVTAQTLLAGVAGVSIRLYKRNNANQLIVDYETPIVYAPAGQTRITVTTDTQLVDAEHVAVGFVLHHTQAAAGATDVTWLDPVGCAGRFTTLLPFSPARDPSTQLQHYVQVHRAFLRGHQTEPAAVGYSFAIAPMYGDLGIARVQAINLAGYQNSVKVSSVVGTLDDDQQTLNVSGNVTLLGSWLLDSKLLIDVLYEKPI